MSHVQGPFPAEPQCNRYIRELTWIVAGTSVESSSPVQVLPVVPVVFSAAEWPSSGWCLASSCQISSFAPRLSSVNAPPHTSPWCFWRLRAGYHVDCLSEWFVSFLTIRFKLCLFSRKIPETLPCLSRRISWEAWFRSHYWWCLSRSLGEGDVCPASPL